MISQNSPLKEITDPVSDALPYDREASHQDHPHT